MPEGMQAGAQPGASMGIEGAAGDGGGEAGHRGTDQPGAGPRRPSEVEQRRYDDHSGEGGTMMIPFVFVLPFWIRYLLRNWRGPAPLLAAEARIMLALLVLLVPLAQWHSL